MEYDGILLGTGHNSLILQAYLGRAGLRTLSLDAAGVAGGGLATVEWPEGSGFFHNTHSFFHRGLTGMPWYEDLELAAHGARYVEPPLNVALLTRDGRRLEWWNDFDRTCRSFAQFSSRDAESLARWRQRFRPIVRNWLVPETRRPPLPPAERTRRLSESEAGRLLLEISRWSPRDFVRREFEHPIVQAGLLFFNGLREVDLRLPGFGHHIPALLAGDAMAQMCVGGSRRLAEALVRAVESSGGEVRTGCPLRRLLVAAGRVVGVETVAGERIAARRFIASGLNPQQTFLELLDPSELPDAWRLKAEQFQYNVLAPLFGLYLTLEEPPRYTPRPSSAGDTEPLMVILGLEHPDQFDEIVRHHEAGTIPPTVMWGSCPTRFDAGQAPPNRHTAFMWEKLPFRLQGDPHRWEAVAEAHGDAMFELWREYAPNLSASGSRRFVRTPLDIERTLPNMRGGDLLVGAFANDQIGYHRPFPGAGHYRTHLDGLYLCGACCHPGGNITGLPGYNCGQVLTADLGIEFPGRPRVALRAP